LILNKVGFLMKKKNKAGTFFTPVVAVTGIFLAVIVFVSLFASVIAPYDPLATDVNAIYAPAFSEGHIFGTDGLGRASFFKAHMQCKNFHSECLLL